MQPRLKVIYLDDETELCDLFKELFGSPEVDVETFSDAEAAIEAVNRSRPDLFFVDFRLRGTNGVDVGLRVHPVEMYLISGELSVSPPNVFAGVFYKPYSVPELSALIGRSLLKKKQKGKSSVNAAGHT